MAFLLRRRTKKKRQKKKRAENRMDFSVVERTQIIRDGQIMDIKEAGRVDMWKEINVLAGLMSFLFQHEGDVESQEDRGWVPLWRT